MRQAFAMSASVDVPEKSQVFSDSLRSRVYSALLDKVAQAVAVLDVEGRFLEMNDAHMGLVASKYSCRSLHPSSGPPTLAQIGTL